MGAPGAGKGTQAKRIAERYRVPHVSTGEILRHHIRNDSPLGREAKTYIDEGHLVPDEIVNRIVEERLAYCDDTATGFILDGFPRALAQARELDAMLARRGESLDIALNLAVQDEELVERLVARRQCPKCGEIYNLKFNPPPPPPRCSLPGCRTVALIQREDDREATVRERLRVYHETGDPILNYYEERGKLRTVDGEAGPPDDVFKTIESLIGSRNEAWSP